MIRFSVCLSFPSSGWGTQIGAKLQLRLMAPLARHKLHKFMAPATKSRRLGLFGGTFNPVHYGHLRAAEEVCQALHLNRLWFMPASLPPHKAPKGLTPFAVRLQMTRLAVGRHPRFQVSDIEGRRPGKSYSIETLHLVRQQLGPGWELYFILGLDSILEISTLKDYRELFSLCHFVVLDRPGYARADLADVLLREVHPDFTPISLAGATRTMHDPMNCNNSLTETRKQKTENTLASPLQCAGYQHPSGFKVLLLNTTLMDISATGIRRLVRQGRSIRYLLPEAVRRFIIKNKLYLEEA